MYERTQWAGFVDWLKQLMCWHAWERDRDIKGMEVCVRCLKHREAQHGRLR